MNNSTTTLNEPSISSATPRPSRLARGFMRLIRTYQLFTSGRPSPCRFFPSCSNYASEAIEKHGAGRGLLLALRRLSRCRPLGPHGIDLVPEPRKPRSS